MFNNERTLSSQAHIMQLLMVFITCIVENQFKTVNQQDKYRLSYFFLICKYFSYLSIGKRVGVCSVLRHCPLFLIIYIF